MLPMSSSCSVSLKQVTLVRGLTTVFRELDLELGESRIGIIGDNGAGKSSLFRLLCGLDVPSTGHVRVDGREIGGPGSSRGSIGMMFQNPDEQIIFPIVEEELALGLEVTGLSRRQARERAREQLEARGLGHWAKRAISSLSQGQRQHVCWLALIVAAPRLLLLDEPFASLDLPGQALLGHEIRHASQHIIVSTHLLAHVRDFGRVIWLDQGAIRADGPGAEVCAAYEEDIACRVAGQTLRIDGAQRTA